MVDDDLARAFWGRLHAGGRLTLRARCRCTTRRRVQWAALSLRRLFYMFLVGVHLGAPAILGKGVGRAGATANSTCSAILVSARSTLCEDDRWYGNCRRGDGEGRDHRKEYMFHEVTYLFRSLTCGQVEIATTLHAQRQV